MQKFIQQKHGFFEENSVVHLFLYINGNGGDGIMENALGMETEIER